jgi:hypothetical protein
LLEYYLGGQIAPRHLDHPALRLHQGQMPLLMRIAVTLQQGGILAVGAGFGTLPRRWARSSVVTSAQPMNRIRSVAENTIRPAITRMKHPSIPSQPYRDKQ